MRSTLVPLPIVVASLVLAGCGAKPEPAASARPSASPTPSPTVWATPEPVASAEQNLYCADVRPRPTGPAFFVHGPLRNTGDLPLRLRVTIRWTLAGRDVTAHRTYRLRSGAKRRVRFFVPVTLDTLRRYDKAGEGCTARVDMVGREGMAEVAP